MQQNVLRQLANVSCCKHGVPWILAVRPSTMALVVNRQLSLLVHLMVGERIVIFASLKARAAAGPLTGHKETSPYYLQKKKVTDLRRTA